MSKLSSIILIEKPREKNAAEWYYVIICIFLKLEITVKKSKSLTKVRLKKKLKSEKIDILYY